jgi:hypothetical protein
VPALLKFLSLKAKMRIAENQLYFFFDSSRITLGRMKKKVLIIRSVSFQQLDKNLEKIEKQFPVSRGEWECHLLTHDHGTRRAASYKAISQIIAYGSRRNFTFFHLPPGLRKTRKDNSRRSRKPGYEAVVVPVTNKTGAGFLNVLAMTLRIPSASIYICNLTSDIWKVSRRKIVFQVVKSSWFSLLSVVLVLPLMIFILPVLGLSFIKKRIFTNIL